MSPLAYFGHLFHRSFHGTLRVLEVGEAVSAIVVYVVGFFAHEWKEPLEVLFVVLACLLIVTFLLGMFLAAYSHQKDTEQKHATAEAELRARIEQLESASAVPGLSDDAKRLLVKAAEPESHGTIMFVVAAGGGGCSAGVQQFMKEGTAREVKYWEGVVGELVLAGFVERVSQSNFEVTTPGYEEADRLRVGGSTVGITHQPLGGGRPPGDG